MNVRKRGFKGYTEVRSEFGLGVLEEVFWRGSKVDERSEGGCRRRVDAEGQEVMVDDPERRMRAVRIVFSL